MISVIFPTLNAGDSIGELLASLQGQTVATVIDPESEDRTNSTGAEIRVNSLTYIFFTES